MQKKILIAGSGRLARELGIYFITQGQSVAWVSRTVEGVVDLQGWVDDAIRTFLQEGRGTVKSISAAFYLYNELENSTFDIIVESTLEDGDVKRDVVARLQQYLSDRTIFMSTSMGVPCDVLDPRCCGLRVVLPLMVEKRVSVLFPKGYSETLKSVFSEFFAEMGIMLEEHTQRR